MSQVDNNIRGRLALITGASGGIGAACARQLASHGVHLALTYSSNLTAITTLTEELHAQYPATATTPALRITTHRCDVGSVEQVQQLCVNVRREHDAVVDILVSNAGYGVRITDVWDIPIEEFEHTFNVNLRASFLLVKGVVEGMRDQRWGRIIFVSSIAAYGAGINGCHYAASKGGLTGMMKNLASRLAEHNISVNDVAPALIGSTGMIPSADVIPGGASSIPLGRLGTPEEVANAVLMFATSGYTTGQSLIIAGGLRYL